MGSVLPWVQHDEYLIGMNMPDGRADVTNRVVRRIIESMGADPDAPFTGFGIPTYNVKAYGGAKGDGVSNDTAAIQACFDDAPEGSTIEFPDGVYLVDQVVSTKRFRVVGYGATIKLNSAQVDGGAIVFVGSHGTLKTTLTAPASVGEQVLSVADASGFQAGDWVRIKDLSAVTADFAYEWHQIKLIVGNDLHLRDSLDGDWSYPSGSNGEVTLWQPIEGVVVEGLSFDGDGWGATDHAPLAFHDCVGPRVRNVRVRNYRTHGIAFDQCLYPLVDGAVIENATTDLSIALGIDAGYAVHTGEATSYCAVVNSYMANCRHGIDFGEGSRYCRAVNNTVVGFYAAAINTHFRRAVDILFVGNTISGVTTKSPTDPALPTGPQGISISGVDYRDARVVIANNTISNVSGIGIYCVSDAYDGSGETIIVGNNVYNCKGSGSFASIYVTRRKSVTISDNIIRRTDTVDFPALRVFSCEGLTIGQNHIHFTAPQSGAGNRCFWLTDCKHAVVIGNTATIDGVSCQAFRVTSTGAGNTDDIALIGNNAIVSGGAVELLIGSNVTNIQKDNNSWDRGLTSPVVAKTTNYNLTGLDATVSFDATSGQLTAGLPAAASFPGRFFTIKKVDSSANAVVVDANGSETIDGSLTVTLTKQHDTIVLQSTGSGWFIVGGNVFMGEKVILEAYDNVGGMEATNAHVQASGARLLPGNNGFYPTSVGTAPAIRQQDGRKLWRLATSGAGFVGARYSDIYGAPIGQQLSASLVGSVPRKFRRYYFAVTVQMSSAPANCKCEVGWKTNGSELELNATTWGVVAVIKNGSGWLAQSKLASGGGVTTGSDSGLSGTTARRIEFEYVEGLTPTLTVKVDGTVIFTASGNGQMPTVADGSTVNVFGCSIGGYSNGVTVNVDYSDCVYRVTELP